VFFEGEALNESDPVLMSIPDPRARERLIARRRTPRDVAQYEIDIVLRGAGETPFFDDWN
jgi:protocatechuate 3,4-dioxygenase beta subunit